MIIEGPNHLLKSALPISQPLPKAVQSQFGSSSISEFSGSCIFAPFRAIWNFFAWIKSLICCEKPTAYELPKFTVETFAKIMGGPKEQVRQDSEGCFRIGTKEEVTFRIVTYDLEMTVEFPRKANDHQWSKRELLSPALAPLACFFHNTSAEICEDPEIKAFGYEKVKAFGYEKVGETDRRKKGNNSFFQMSDIIYHLKNHWDFMQGAEVKDAESVVYNRGELSGKLSHPQWKVEGFATLCAIKVVPYGEEDFALEVTPERPIKLSAFPKDVNLIIKDYKANGVDLDEAQKEGFEVQGKDLVRLKSKE